MRRYKKIEVAECQTVLQCSPFILEEGEFAVVVSNQNTQTIASCPPDEEDNDFYPQLKRVNPEDIKEDAIKIVKYKANKHLTFEFPDDTSACSTTEVNDLVCCVPSFYNTSQIHFSILELEVKEGSQDAQTQTKLMVYPHFLRENDFAVVSVEMFTQTSVSCEPQTSVTDLIPQLKMFMEHDGIEIELSNDILENGSVVEIILGIIKEIEKSHRPAMGPDILEYLQTTCVICKEETLDLSDQERIDNCEALCRAKQIEVLSVSQEVQVDIASTEEQEQEEILAIEEPTKDEASTVDEPSEDEKDSENISDMLDKKTSVEEESVKEESDKEESDKDESDKEESDKEESNKEKPPAENGAGEESSIKNNCQDCICNGFIIRLHINNLGLTAEVDPSKDVCLELNILPEFENISVKVLTKEEQEAEDYEEKEICDSICCITEKNENRDVKKRKTFTLPDGRKTDCPVIVSKINKEGKRYFCREDENESTESEPLEETKSEEMEFKSAELEADLADLEADLAEQELMELDTQVAELETEAQAEEITEPEQDDAVIQPESESEIIEPQEEVVESETRAEPVEFDDTADKPTEAEISSESLPSPTSEPCHCEDEEITSNPEQTEDIEPVAVGTEENEPAEDMEETEQCLCENEEITSNPEQTEDIEPVASGTEENEPAEDMEETEPGKLPPCYCDDEEITSNPEQTEDIEPVAIDSEVYEPAAIDSEVYEPAEDMEETEPVEIIVEVEPADTTEPTKEDEQIGGEEIEQSVENEPGEEDNQSEFIEDEQEETDYALPFCEKKIVKKKRSRPLLESRAMTITNLLNGTVMALVTKISKGFDITINIKNPNETNSKTCTCQDDQPPSDDDNDGTCSYCNNDNDTCSCEKTSNVNYDQCTCEPEEQPTVLTPGCYCNEEDKSNMINSCCGKNKNYSTDDEYETCSDGPSTARSKNNPEIMEPIPETNPNLKFSSTNAQLTLPDNTVLNLVLSLNMKNDQICPCSKKSNANVRRYNSKLSNVSKYKQPTKEQKFFNIHNISSRELPSTSYLKDVNSYLFTDSSRTINILSPSMLSTGSYFQDRSRVSLAAVELYPSIFGIVGISNKDKKLKKLEKKISFRQTFIYDDLKESSSQSQNFDNMSIQPDSQNENYCNKATCQYLSKGKKLTQSKSCTCSCATSSKVQEKSTTPCKVTKECCTKKKGPEIPHDEKQQDVVYMAFKACEVELKPVITALTNIRQELKNLNMPEVDSIFTKLDVYPDIPKKSAFQKKVSELNKPDNVCKINSKLSPTQVSKDVSKMSSKRKLKFNYKCLSPQYDNLLSQMCNLPTTNVVCKQIPLDSKLVAKTNRALCNKSPKTPRTVDSNSDLTCDDSNCKQLSSQNSSKQQKRFSLSCDSNTNNSTSYKYRNPYFNESNITPSNTTMSYSSSVRELSHKNPNSNYTYKNTQFNYDPLSKKSKPFSKYYKGNCSSKLTFQTNPTYDSAYYSSPKTPKISARNDSSSSLFAEACSLSNHHFSEVTIKQNNRCNKKTSCCCSNITSDSFRNFDGSLSSNVSSHVSSETFIYPSRSISYCESKHGKKRKRSSKICKSTSSDYCPYIEAMKSVLYLNKTPSKKGRKCY